ncbi:hypothetical protein OKW39_005221 [Paraburkholderia sp. MM6662-R1]
MGEGQAALSHHLDKITQTELVAQIPTHAKDDDFAVEMTPVEQPFEIFQLAHLARGRQKLKSNRPMRRNCTTTVPKTVTSSATTHGRFGKEDIIFNATTNEYRCPAGERLIWQFSTVERGLKISKYWSSNCQQCPQKGGCTPRPQRRVTRREHEAVLDDM